MVVMGASNYGGGEFTAGQDVWLAAKHVNNNNNPTNGSGQQGGSVAIDAGKVSDVATQKQIWNCESCSATRVGASSLPVMVADGAVEDEGGGDVAVELGEEKVQQNGCTSSFRQHVLVNSTLPTLIPVADANVDVDYNACAEGAASLTPPGDSHSNRTSVNNSTENLSYSSDNYYADDLLLLDDDVEAEEISLNSDDCVYAYRGDGTNFIDLDAINSREGNAGIMDDETDFLEMDYEPDPPSEVEYGSVEAQAHADAFQLQRDSSLLSGRHSANMSLHPTPTQQRQLFSSPIDDLPPPKALQSQSLLSKNFARISLHLDQINKGENEDFVVEKREPTRRERLASLVITDIVDAAKTAHSLPSTFNANFSRDTHDEPETKISPSKVTGAKPKRFSTFSLSSSTSSKNSSKSRTSLRAFAPAALCNSSSFDERSVSCAEFRSIPPEDCVPNPVDTDDVNMSDETCLDCLEKEFLANTIGKALDTSACIKCRKRNSSLSLYTRAERARCRSGSPSFFTDMDEDGLLATDFLSKIPKREDWTAPAPPMLGRFGDINRRAAILLPKMSAFDKSGGELLNQRRLTCDNSAGEHLLKNLLLTEPETVTVSTLNLNEETLVQALDKFHIMYNGELLKSYFMRHSSTTNMHKPTKNYNTFKQFLLHESKRNCNHAKLKRLIDLCTREQLDVQFNEDATITESEIVHVKVSDILEQWTRIQSLDSLRHLNKRFVEANVLGKIANIIRQAQQQRISPRRPLPEFITIPQYYPSGYLILTKKC